MSNRTKMYASNSAARKFLLDSGYTDIHLFPHSRFSKDVHFKGMGFDGIATLGKKLAMFQIKSNCACTKKMKEQMRIASLDSGVILLWINAVNKKLIIVTTTEQQ